MPNPQPVLYYMFSGPDFLYADAFFPKASTYVLSGLEPIGTVPELSDMPLRSLSGELRQLQSSLNSVMSYSFFITNNMRKQLRTGKVNGTLPIIYVFLARLGKTIDEVSLVDLDQDGAVHPEGKVDAKVATKRENRLLADEGATALYYFTTDIQCRFQKLPASELGGARRGDAFIKRAPTEHSAGSSGPDFLLQRDDPASGDSHPLQYQNRGWGAAALWARCRPDQPVPRNYKRTRKRFSQTSPDHSSRRYRWPSNESSLLLAVRSPWQPCRREQ